MQIVSALFMLLLTFSAFAQKEMPVDDMDVQGLVIGEADEAFMASWGISEEEYQRYLYLKEKTPRGIYTPEANPIAYLGLEARTEQEREKYALMMAKIEFDNFNKVDKFQKAWQLALVKLYGAGDVVDLSEADRFKEKLASVAKKQKSKVVKVLFVNDTCVQCSSEYKKLYDELRLGRIGRIEIAFAGDMNNGDIKKWATNSGVPLNLVNDSGLIVLRKQGKHEKITKYPYVTVL